MNEVRDYNDDDRHVHEDNIHTHFWNESRNGISLGMRFERKSQLKISITLWYVAQNRELRVVESRINTWDNKMYRGREHNCGWHVRA